MKKSNFGLIAKGIINYLSAVALAVIFALFLSGRIGWFLVIAFICAPVISCVTAYISSRKLYVECNVSYNTVCKGEGCEVEINLTNDSFMPSPPVMIDLMDCPSVKCRDKRYSVSVMPFGGENVTVEYAAVICGKSEIGINKIKVSDYFGIMYFDIPLLSDSSLTYEIAVIPDIAEIGDNSEIIRNAAELSAQSDDSEDTVDTPLSYSGGFPGYESREYVPGDPLKRINWKQSVRRGKLFVRKDEEAVCSGIAVILDKTYQKDKIIPSMYSQTDKFFGKNDEEIIPLIAQDAVENFLGISVKLMEKGFSVTSFVKTSEGWNSYRITGENDIAQLRTDLASYEFLTDCYERRFPSDEIDEIKGSVSVFCTPYADRNLYEECCSSENNMKSDRKVVIYAAAHDKNINERKNKNES